MFTPWRKEEQEEEEEDEEEADEELRPQIWWAGPGRRRIPSSVAPVAVEGRRRRRRRHMLNWQFEPGFRCPRSNSLTCNARRAPGAPEGRPRPVQNIWSSYEPCFPQL